MIVTPDGEFRVFVLFIGIGHFTSFFLLACYFSVLFASAGAETAVAHARHRWTKKALLPADRCGWAVEPASSKRRFLVGTLYDERYKHRMNGIVSYGEQCYFSG
jgi:hypothetical protein